MTFYFVNYEKKSKVQRQAFETTVKEHEAKISARNLCLLHDNLWKDIEFLHVRMSHFYNLRRQKSLSFKKEKKVFLLRRNIKTKRSSEKLNHRKLRSFKISKVIENVNYKLQLLNTMKIHSVFHVSLLEKINQNVIAERTETQNEEEYEIEKILERASIEDKDHYLIKWKDYSISKNTWESRKHLRNAQNLVRRYHRRDSRETKC